MKKDQPTRLRLVKAMEKELNYKRFLHSMGVAETAAALAMRYDADIEQAEIAGILHDCAKYMDDKELISICKKHSVPISEAEYDNPALLHAKAGAILAEEKYEIDDPEILEAIRNHTTGKPAMSLLDKIIYVADYIEPGRCQAPNLSIIRSLAFEDLDRTLFKILEDILLYLQATGARIDPMTGKTYQYYRDELGF
ncbi:MAG: bis(5'-nucleosyl)-tetraphosphatase (symmetrical) YqeK [Lachnospiraceae bacterium]|nr:bis(5'-nucleosyl)-tetraphosphatase (symmetrical) YqeK [Lachnospiraceae bacterium]